jgi:hypothetical protein
MSKQDYSSVRIESTLTRSWEEERSFNDVLYEWLGRAPYLAVAIALHLLGIFILHLVDWSVFDRPEEQIIQATIEPVVEEIFEEPEPEEPEEIEEVEIEDPVLMDAVDDVVDELTDDVSDVEAPFENPNMSNTEIGIGGGAGGGMGGGRAGRRGGARPNVNAAVRGGLEWLKDHQNSAGYWSSDNFMVECKQPNMPLSDGPGEPGMDIGVTGLALLAFLGYGDTMSEGEYQDVIRRGIGWLRSVQIESGLFGQEVGSPEGRMYSHAIATLAMCEALYTSKGSPMLRRPAQNAVNYILQARNPYSAWRYSNPGNGQNDTSITGWMVFALAAAVDAGLTVDNEAFRGALSWFDEVTDPATGRTGYTVRGGASSRSPANRHYPWDKTETNTAAALLCRIFIANILDEADPTRIPAVQRSADLLRSQLPVWSNDGMTNDKYYWYYGSYAMFQYGGAHWRDWERAMEQAILPHQRDDGCFKGSWDPNGPWGFSGGRVYSTALMVLNLEVFYRYARLAGAR